MNLKSVAMATGLVPTFAAGAWLSTIMLASPQRPNRVAVQEQERTPAPSPQTTTAQFPQVHPERLPEMAASDSILPPLPPLPPVSAGVPAAPAPVPVPVPVAEVPPAAPATSVVPESPVSAAPPEPPPAEPILQAPEPPPPPPPILVEAPPEQPPVATVEAVPEPPALLAAPAPVLPVEPPHEPDIDPGIAALSALVGRAPSTPSASAPSAQPVSPAPQPQPHRAAPPEPPRSAPTSAPAAQPSGSYFTIQVGSFQDPANAASLVRSLGTKGWEAFVVDWANSTGQIWKVVRVGRYQTEAQAVSASAELTSAANLRGNVIKVR